MAYNQYFFNYIIPVSEKRIFSGFQANRRVLGIRVCRNGAVEFMEEEQNNLPEETGEVSDGANDGIGPGDSEEQGSSEFGQGLEDDPYGVKKRLGMQAKKHQRELRQMHEKLMHLESQLSNGSGNNHHSPYNSNPYPSPGQPNPPGMTEEERIEKAVRFALGAKEHEERQARDAERQAHVHKQYQRLNNEFDRASDKYEDFDDVVRGDDVPFTPHVRDALLLVENPAEVAYKLGKNKSELERISRLHPLDQAREVNKLSFSLMNGNSGKVNSATKANPLGEIKANPAHSSGAVTDKTPASAIRARMKAGTWK